MCGIVGFYNGLHSDDSREIIWNMTNALVHRGPDDKGIWKDNDLNIYLGHRRLSILDLSKEGHQPMVSRHGNLIILLNGEIYNHKDLRSQLGDTISWRGSSDTETVLECISNWGFEKTLEKIEGMFSIALWDLQRKELSLARDPFGEKPLYYGWQKKLFLFGSELKSFKHHPNFQPTIDKDSLALYFRHNCIPAPYTIYKGIKKLMPGSFITLDFKHEIKAMESQPRQYWNLNEAIEASKNNIFEGDEIEAYQEIELQLESSVRQQMISDVPLGGFLSGGIDSSTIISLMQKNSISPVKTFTMGFSHNEYDEAIYAKDVANHLGTDHTELYVTPKEAMSVIPHLPSIYCEPFSDSSQIPTYLVSKLASENVTVSLSGDGGDEIFGGYNRYIEGQKTWSSFNKLPRSIRHSFARALVSISPHIWDSCFSLVKNILPKKLRFTAPGDKIHKLADVMFEDTLRAYYEKLCSHWHDPEEIVFGSNEYPSLLSIDSEWLNSPNFTEKMMAMDIRTYMSDDILVKVDRAAMACSLETRVPMLSKKLVQAAWSLPIDMKIREGKGKWPLRQILYKYVPKDLIERPKQGFGIPIGNWLRGPLKEWAGDLLSRDKLLRDGYINPDPVLKLWQEHQKGENSKQYHLWDVLMFQQWLEKEKF